MAKSYYKDPNTGEWVEEKKVITPPYNDEAIKKDIADLKDKTANQYTKDETYNKEEVDNLIPEIPTIPTKVSELENDSNFVSDDNYTHTDNNYTTADKEKLDSLSNYDDTEVKEEIGQLNESKVDSPTEQGTAGQVLGLDDELKPVWRTPEGGGSGTKIIADVTTNEMVSVISVTPTEELINGGRYYFRIYGGYNDIDKSLSSGSATLRIRIRGREINIVNATAATITLVSKSVKSVAYGYIDVANDTFALGSCIYGNSITTFNLMTHTSSGQDNAISFEIVTTDRYWVDGTNIKIWRVI